MEPTSGPEGPVAVAPDAIHGAVDGVVTRRVTTRLELPTGTIVKIVLTLAILWLLARLWTLLLVLVVAALLATALDPVVSGLQRRGWPRPLAVAVIVVALLASVAALGFIVVPPAIREGEALARDLPDYVERGRRFLDNNPALLNRLRTAASQGSADPGAVAGSVLRFGSGLVGTVVNIFVGLVLTIYLLVDGQRVVRWLLRYLPPRQQTKVRRALPEIGRVVSGYVVGQAITSALFGLFALAVLSLLGVPQALLLALLAALMDAIPIAGILVATVPAVLLALTVSWPTAAIVLVAYVAYQQVENYLIVPRVYRGTLQISSLAVLIAVLVGGELLGILGVLLALPVAATLPVVEQIWRDEPATGGSPSAQDA